MDAIHFADGIDTPERVLLGLQPAQLVVAVCGLLMGYATSRLPLPAGMRLPLAASVVTLSAGLAWARVAGRPALDWAAFWLRFVLRRREGSLLLAAAAPSAVGARTGGTLLSLPAQPRPSRPARRVCFFSFKGGVGRTTLAVEAAACLAAHADLRVALLDLNTTCPCVGVRMGLPEPSAAEVERTGGAMRVLHASGVQVVPWLQRAACNDSDGSWTASLLDGLDEDRFDVVVADLGPCLTASATACMRRAHDVFIVVTPTAAGVGDAYRSAAALRGLGIRDSLRLVVNRAQGGGDVSEVVTDLRIPLAATIKEDAEIALAEHTRAFAWRSGGGAAAGVRGLVQQLLHVEA